MIISSLASLSLASSVQTTKSSPEHMSLNFTSWSLLPYIDPSAWFPKILMFCSKAVKILNSKLSIKYHKWHKNTVDQPFQWCLCRFYHNPPHYILLKDSNGRMEARLPLTTCSYIVAVLQSSWVILHPIYPQDAGAGSGPAQRARGGGCPRHRQVPSPAGRAAAGRLAGLSGHPAGRGWRPDDVHQHLWPARAAADAPGHPAARRWVEFLLRCFLHLHPDVALYFPLLHGHLLRPPPSPFRLHS